MNVGGWFKKLSHGEIMAFIFLWPLVGTASATMPIKQPRGTTAAMRASDRIHGEVYRWRRMPHIAFETAKAGSLMWRLSKVGAETDAKASTWSGRRSRSIADNSYSSGIQKS